MTTLAGVRPARAATAAWCVGGAVAAALLLATARISLVLPVVIAAALILAVLAALRPHVFVIVGLTIISLTVLLERVGGSIAGQADEAVVAISVVAFTTRRLVTEGRVIRLPGTVPLLVFLGAGIVSSALQHVPVQIVASAALIYLKAALYAFALAQLRWTDRDLRRLVRAGGVAAVIVAVTGCVNLLAPNFWAGLTTGHPPIHFYGPIAALNGPFQHPAAMSRFCALLAVGALVYAVVVRSSPGIAAIAIITAAFSILTFEVKSLLGLIAAYAVFGLRWVRPSGVVAFLCIAPAALLAVGPFVVGLVADTLNTYVFQESARLRLTTGAVELADRFLPFGAGLGRWGSSPAATNYSPLYTEQGFDKIWGLSPDNPMFLNDTQWPGILGETGWLGALAFVVAIVVGVRSLLRPVGADERPLERWIRIAGVGWAIILVVESIAAPVFVSTPSYPFLFLAVGITASIRRARADAPAAAPPVAVGT